MVLVINGSTWNGAVLHGWTRQEGTGGTGQDNMFKSNVYDFDSLIVEHIIFNLEIVYGIARIEFVVFEDQIQCARLSV